MPNPSREIDRLERIRSVAQSIIAGLQGKPFHWNGVERRAWTPVAEMIGCQLVTETGIKRRNHRLKRGVTPVGSAYYNAPISRNAALYVLGVQTESLAKPAPTPEGETEALPLDEDVEANTIEHTLRQHLDEMAIDEGIEDKTPPQ